MKNVQKLLSASVSFTLGALITPFTAWAEVTSDRLMPSAKDSGLCSLSGKHLLGALALLAPLSWIPLKYQDTQVQSWTLFPICLLSLGCLLAQGFLVYLQTIPPSWASNWNLDLSSKTVSQKMLKKKNCISTQKSSQIQLIHQLAFSCAPPDVSNTTSWPKLHKPGNWGSSAALPSPLPHPISPTLNIPPSPWPLDSCSGLVGLLPFTLTSTNCPHCGQNEFSRRQKYAVSPLLKTL